MTDAGIAGNASDDYIAFMVPRATATLTIRNVELSVRDRLRVRAARHGRSMEAELRHIVAEAVAGNEDDQRLNLAEAIRRRFAPLGGVELDLPSREPMRDLPSMDE